MEPTTAAAHAVAAAIWNHAPDRPHPWDELTAEDQAACAVVAAPLVPAIEKATAALAKIARLLDA